MVNTSWREVDSNNPCPICGKPDWCSVSQDGAWAVCRRVDTGEGRHKVDAAGMDYYVYPLTREARARSEIPVYERQEAERAEPDILHSVYSSLLSMLQLSQRHGEALEQRGLTAEAIRTAQYRTLPKQGRKRLAESLAEQFGVETCARVPGWYIKQDGDQSWPSFAGAAGLLIPVRDAQGRIIGLLTRPDEPVAGAKYLWITSRRKDYDGPGPGAPPHVPLHRDAPGQVVRLTEGVLKADIATALGRMLTIGLAGVSAYRPALPILRQLGTKRVHVAFDADLRENEHVARALMRTCAALETDGFEVAVEVWSPKRGKGIDDLLASGGWPEIGRLEELTQEIAATEEVREEEKLQKARAVVMNLPERIRESPGTAFEPEVVGALALLSEHDLRTYTEVKESLRGKVSLRDLERAIKQAGKKRHLRAVQPGETAAALDDDGFFEQDGVYCVRSYDSSGRPQVSIVSNFVLRPKTRLQMQDEEVVEADLYVKGHPKPWSIYLRRRDLLGWRDLMAALPTSKAKWLGRDKEVQRLRGHLAAANIPMLRGETVMGWHGDQFILPDQVWGAGGRIKNPDVIYVRSKLSFERHVRFEECANWPDLARQILPLLCQLHEPRVLWPMVGWFFATMVAPQVREISGHFPLLQVFGTKGGGKTTLLRTLWRLFGVDAEAKSCRQSAFNLIRELSSSNAIPIVLDEYKPGEMSRYHLDNLHYFLRLAYDGAVEGRGRQDLSTVEYRLVCPVAVGGEARFVDPALIERTVMVTLNRNWLYEHPECVEAMATLQELPLRQFAGGYVTGLAGEPVDDLFEAMHNVATDVSRGMTVPARVVDSAATALLGLELLASVAEEVGANLPQRWEREQVARWIIDAAAGDEQPKTGLDLFVMGMANMAHLGELSYGIDYIAQNDYLIFATEPIIAAYTKWCRQLGQDGQNPGREALRQQLKENEGRPDSYVVASYGQVRRLGPRTARCTVLSIPMLERMLDIDPGTWVMRDKNHVPPRYAG